MKALSTLAFYALALGGYVGSGYLVEGRSYELRPSSLDHSIPYDPRFAGLYLAFFPYMLWILWRLSRLSGFTRHLLSASVVLALSFAIFLLFPTHVDRSLTSASVPAAAWIDPIHRYDPQANALPSLHASLTLFASLLAVRRRVLPAWLAAIATLSILYAALALKQHLVIDLTAGAALGLFALCLDRKLESRTPIATAR